MIRILGVGSPFGADRLAWEAIDHLDALGLDGCELVKLDRPGSVLLTYFTGVDHLILLDALACERAPGEVSLLDPVRLQRLSSGTSSHGFGVSQAIDLAEKLNLLPDRLQIVGIHTGGDLSSLPTLDTKALEAMVRSLM
jgi:hydrogenase maturation protease